MQMQPLTVVGLLLIALSGLIATIFYLLTAQKALRKCAPVSRTMSPGMVWLMLIPVFGLVWQFVIVSNLTKSLQNEFGRLGNQRPEEDLGKGKGLAMCVCNCCIILPYIGRLAGLPALVLWIAYWYRIAKFSSLLDVPEHSVSASPTG